MGSESKPTLHRRLGVLNATSINMSNMVGIGPFIAIPLILTTLNGPHSYLAWLVGVAIAVCDGLVVAELGAALPAAGGTYVFLREGFGKHTWGRLRFSSSGRSCSRARSRLPVATSGWSSI